MFLEFCDGGGNIFRNELNFRIRFKQFNEKQRVIPF